MSLASTTKSGTGGSFDLAVKSSNAPVNIETVKSPVDSVLHLHASTSNAALTAKTHPTYEGAFSIRTSSFSNAVVRMDEEQDDPAGKGRKRSLEIRSVRKGTNEGNVTWPPIDDREMGSINLSTSNSPAYLLL